MQKLLNDFVLHVATVNGSGSQSSNNVLVRSLFRMGLPVGGKNLFPSNIAGLPTWFTIRVNDKGYTARKKQHDIVVAMNEGTIVKDTKDLKEGGLFIYNSDLRFDKVLLRNDVVNVGVPFREIVKPVTDSIKLRKLLTNMVYVGILAELLNINQDTLETVVHDQFGDKANVIEVNLKAVAAGRNYARTELSSLEVPYGVEAIPGGNKGKILIDGNTSGGLGLLFGGCTFVAWYPITPSSSLVESFISYANKYRLNDKNEKTFAVVQAEDELSSICMVVGAGWAGARAMTATSGPGLSLMAEAAGLSYYAEIPAVVWDVQRVGPSTGLPTRTMQGDLLSAVTLSHGDTRHVVLLPGNPEECFEFGQTAFDLAERLQTLVLVLTDLDMGMNLHIAQEFSVPEKPFDRGKVLDKEALDQVEEFARYKDVDGDAIPYRTLPGTEHPKAAYFTRGTGHNEKAGYSEDSDVFRANMERLERKYETAKKYVPQPMIDLQETSDVAVIAFGSSDAAMPEARDLLKDQSVSTNYLRLRAIPFTDSVKDFISQHQRVYVVEQNRDAQLLGLLLQQYPEFSNKLQSVTQFDGLPLEAEYIKDEILKVEKKL